MKGANFFSAVASAEGSTISSPVNLSIANLVAFHSLLQNYDENKVSKQRKQEEGRISNLAVSFDTKNLEVDIPT